MENKNTAKKKKIIIIVAAILVVAAAVIFIFCFNSPIRATTMRLLRMEGEVTLEEDGEKKSVRENLRLHSGNALMTAVNSLVSIGLDDTKIVTLDESSRAIFNQAGKELDLELTDGSLFFEVQKPLEDDEKMDIRTSTMIVGIRGTSGWVSVEGDHESLIVTDGHVHVIGINPTTGERKETDVCAGQMVRTYLYNDRKVDSIMFYVDKVTERDLPEFLLDRLRENPALLDKVCKETGWDKDVILGRVVAVEDSTIPVDTEEKVNEVSEDVSDSDIAESSDEISENVSETDTKKAEEDAQAAQMEELLKLMAMTTTTPTPTPVPVEKQTEDDEDDEDDDEEETVVVNQVEYNKLDPKNMHNGNYVVNFSGGNGTGEYNPQSGVLTITGSNGGFIKLPATLTDENNQTINLSTSYTNYAPNAGVTTIDATEYPNSGTLLTAIGQAKTAGNPLEYIENGSTQINLSTQTTTVTANNTQSNADNFRDIVDMMDNNNYYTHVEYGNTIVDYENGKFNFKNKSTSSTVFSVNNPFSLGMYHVNNELEVIDNGNIVGYVDYNGNAHT